MITENWLAEDIATELAIITIAGLLGWPTLEAYVFLVVQL